jgi:hypothetical protein
MGVRVAGVWVYHINMGRKRSRSPLEPRVVGLGLSLVWGWGLGLGLGLGHAEGSASGDTDGGGGLCGVFDNGQQEQAQEIDMGSLDTGSRKGFE